MNPIRLAFIASALALLGGCVAVPVGPGYYGDAPAYYGGAPAYYGAAPGYYTAPYYYGPSVGIGVYGGRVWRDGGRSYHHRDYRRDGRRDGYRRDAPR